LGSSCSFRQDPTRDWRWHPGIPASLPWSGLGCRNANYWNPRDELVAMVYRSFFRFWRSWIVQPLSRAALMVFGASLGSLDVAMNLHAVEVERALSRPLMSGFHALFSIGGFAGSGFMTLMLSSHISPFHSSAIGFIAVACAVSAAAPHLLRTSDGTPGPLFVLLSSCI